MGMRKGGRPSLFPGSGDGSTLSLDFTTMGNVLDPRLTFNRDSTATFVNSSGYVEYAAHNLYYNTNFATITTGTGNPSLTSKGWSYVFSTGTAVFNTDGSVSMTAVGNRVGLLRSAGFAGTGRRLIFSVDITSVGDTGLPPSQLVNEGTKTNDAYYINGTLWTSGNVVGPCTLSFVFTSNPAGNAATYFGIGMSSNATGIVTFANPRWGLYGGVNQLAYSPNTSATNANYLTAEYHAPRFDYSPTNIGEPRGLLIEQSVKNFMLQSQALSGLTPYGMIAISIDGTVPDPMGGAETKKIAADGTTTLHAFLRFITADTATTVTVSIFAKKNGYKYLYLSEGTTNTAAARFNLETGVSDVPVVGAGYVSSKMTPYPNGWWRCEMVANITASSNRGWAIGAAPNSGVTYSVNGATYLGSNNSNDGIYAFGWQVEAGSSASSYVPTVASQVTRTIDRCGVSGTNFSSWFVQGAGTLYAVSDVVKSNGRNLIARIENTAATTYIEMGLNAVGYTTEAVAYQGASFTSAFTTYTPTFNTAYKSAYTWEAGRLDLAVNGVSPAAAGATLATDLDRVGIGNSFSNTDVYARNGHIKQLKYYPFVMTDAQLNALTTP
jgi:hypothetical protein